jgi:hypothetical protein
MGTFPVEPHVIDLFWARNLGLRRHELAPNFPNIARGLFLTCQLSSVARPSHHALHDYIAIAMASKKDLRRPDLSKSPREEATIHLESCVWLTSSQSFPTKLQLSRRARQTSAAR